MPSNPSAAPHVSCLRVGQDLQGRWLVQDSEGLIEGTFQSRDTAIGFARSEGEIHNLPFEVSATPLTSHLLH